MPTLNEVSNEVSKFGQTKPKEHIMYIKEYTNGIFVRTEKNDRPCTNPDGHKFTIHGAWGSTCHHCGHYAGGTRMETMGEAQWYAQSILGATGPVEVR